MMLTSSQRSLRSEALVYSLYSSTPVMHGALTDHNGTKLGSRASTLD